ncbi:MAG: ABC transporter ATP-binding protein [Oscillospiraceae bacterium]
MSIILAAENLSKNYTGKKALDDLTLNVEQGKIVGLLGPNGSGKTTLLKIAAGLLVPSSGSVKIADKAPGIETKKIVSYLPERTYLGGSTRTDEALAMFADFYADFNKAKALDMLAALKILPTSRISEMSKGTREKMQLVLVMSRSAELYLLDEPIGGVDPAARDYILNTILNNYAENSTVIISTHLISDIEKILDDVIFINNGHLALQGSVDAVREENGKSIDETFREVFKC